MNKLGFIVFGPFWMPSQNLRSGLFKQNDHDPKIIYLLMIANTYTIFANRKAY